jgi:hypothetical protein
MQASRRFQMNQNALAMYRPMHCNATGAAEYHKHGIVASVLHDYPGSHGQ